MLIILAFSWFNAQKLSEERKAREAATPTEIPAPYGEIPTPATPSIPLAPDQAEAVAERPVGATSAVSSWEWLPWQAGGEDGRPVTVESGLYRVTFSTRGAVPVSWQLTQYRELLADPRFLRLQASRGTMYMQQKARLELNRLESHQAGNPRFVDAIDPHFDSSGAGLVVRWGRAGTDASLSYETPSDHYTVTDPAGTEVRFSLDSKGVRLEKIYRFYPESYHLDFEIRITNQSGQPIPYEQDGFYDVMWMGGFGFPSFRWDADNSVYIQQEGSIHTQPAVSLLSELQNSGTPYLREYGPDAPTHLVTGKPVGWAGVGQKYFLAALIPHTPTRMALKGISFPQKNEAQSIYKPHAGIRMPMTPILDGAVHSDKFTVYVGSMDEDNLAKAQAGLEDARQIFLRRIVGPIANLMLRLLQGLYAIVPNYGVVIILLTVIIKLLMLPLYQKQIRSMKKMQALQPQINELKNRYKDDPQKLQKEQMELFKKHKVNPLSGCLMMLTTIPIFIALYATFAMAVELRGAPFVGWIHDLSAPDGAFFIPIGSSIFTINILPIAYAVLMLWSSSQQKMEGPNAAMMKIFPLIFVFFFWSIASGVILYFVVSIFIDVVQRLMMEKFSPEPVPASGKDK